METILNKVFRFSLYVIVDMFQETIVFAKYNILEIADRTNQMATYV